MPQDNQTVPEPLDDELFPADEEDVKGFDPEVRRGLDDRTGSLGVGNDGVGDAIEPHNAQKGQLRERLGDQATPNTVEKFQGGERDAIFVSATASDPDYVRAESDFLLNPNRLNVAMSRMKKKLVVIASESVFQVIPTDADAYDKSIIWKRLYGEMGVLDELNPAGRFSLGEFLPSGIQQPPVAETTSLTVYTLGTTNND